MEEQAVENRTSRLNPGSQGRARPREVLSRAELQPASLVPALPPALSLVIAGWWGREKLEQGAGGSEGRRRAKDAAFSSACGSIQISGQGVFQGK